MRKSYVSWLFLFLMALSIAACGGGGSNPPASTDTTGTAGTTGTTGTTGATGTTVTPPTDTAAPITPTPPSAPANPAVVVKTGIFVDAPVEGLSFVSGGESGVTDASGTFRFEAGGNVQFKVGNVVLGQASAKALMTPLDLVQAVDAAATATDPRLIQITQFLMTVDSSATVAKMTIPAIVATAALNETAVDLSKAAVNIAAILGRLTTHTLVTTAAATAHLTGATTAFAPAQIIGTFAAVDSVAAPKLGLQITTKPNLAGDGFDVTGVAANIQGASWTIAGTMTTGGVLTATGTGIGAAPPANMTITGAMTTATQVTGAASFSLNNVLQQVPVVFDKAAVPVLTGKFGLPADAGVPPIPLTDLAHVGADMTINVDGTVSAHVVRGQVTGIAALLPLYSSHFAGLVGIVTVTNNIIAFGGVPGAGESFHINGKAVTNPSPVTIFTGTLDPVASTAAIKMTATDLNAGTPATTALNLALTVNPLVGVYQGTTTDPAGSPSTFTFGVNNDGSVHGYTMFLKPVAAGVKQSPFLLDGTVTPATGALAPPPLPFNINVLPGAIAAFPGLVLTDQEGKINLTPGTFAGAIIAGVASGTWHSGVGVPATGTFAGSLVP
jgi:hypothetical protein